MPLAWLFGHIVRFRRWLYDKGVLKSYHPDIPAICVGNLAVGGTGKTPHTAMVVKMLENDYKVSMLSRGYGRKTKGFVLANTVPSDQLSASVIGDEPLLLHLRFPQFPLAVDGNRCEGLLRLLQHAPDIEVVVMDDAFQHLSFTPTFRLILTEYERPYFQDYPLPAGRLREFPDAVKDADVVVVTKVSDAPASIHREQWRNNLGLRDEQPLFFTRYAYANPLPVTEAAQQMTLQAQTEAVLLTGIAHPKPLVEKIQQDYTWVKHFAFPDHHAYATEELEQLYLDYFTNASERALFTTEKDWMRLQDGNLKKIVSLLPVFIVPIEVEFLFEKDCITFNNIIHEHVRRKKRKN